MPTLVLATPISGPALMCTPQSVSREMELPTVLVMPTVRAPLSLQYRRHIRVSAVSPGAQGSTGKHTQGTSGTQGSTGMDAQCHCHCRREMHKLPNQSPRVCAPCKPQRWQQPQHTESEP